MSHVSLTYHNVLSTHHRINTIDIVHDKELYAYIYRFSEERGVKIWRIGGMPDHVHILCDIPPKLALADFVRTLKTEASKFLKTNPHFPYWDGWGEGYAAFTVDTASREVRRQYIMNQKQHHAKRSFEDEMKEIFMLAGVEWPG